MNLGFRGENSATKQLGPGVAPSNQGYIIFFYEMSSLGLLTNLTIGPIYRKFVEGNFIAFCCTTKWQKAWCNKIYEKNETQRLNSFYLTSRGLRQGCTNPVRQVALLTKFYTMAPNICGFSAWNLLVVSLLAPTVFTWQLGFWKICGTLV